MSIILKGVEMPEDCGVCYRETNCFGTGRFQEDGCVWCGLAKGYLGVEETRSKCPLRPLPKKHGRLIEAERLRAEFPYPSEGMGGWRNPDEVLVHKTDVWAAIDCAETIVEAEGD